MGWMHKIKQSEKIFTHFFVLYYHISQFIFLQFRMSCGIRGVEEEQCMLDDWLVAQNQWQWKEFHTLNILCFILLFFTVHIFTFSNLMWNKGGGGGTWLACCTKSSKVKGFEHFKSFMFLILIFHVSYFHLFKVHVELEEWSRNMMVLLYKMKQSEKIWTL